MKIDMSTVIRNLEGVEIKKMDDQKNVLDEFLQLKDLCTTALFTSLSIDKDIQGEEKFKMFCYCQGKYRDWGYLLHYPVQ